MALRIIVELLPFGDVAAAQQLGTALIVNDSTGNLDTGNYDVFLYKRGLSQRVWKRGRVEGFPRQSQGPWNLLYLALEATVGYRTIN